jgi:hypothetical protein
MEHDQLMGFIMDKIILINSFITQSLCLHLNNSADTKEQIESPDYAIYGEGGALDSMGLVRFILTLEEILEDRFDQTIILASQKAMSFKSSPFQKRETLVNYISSKLELDSHG